MIDVKHAADLGPFDLNNLSYDEVILKKSLVSYIQREPFNRISMSGLKIEGYLDGLVGHMVLRMYKYLESEEVGEHCVTYPRDWWQHFKQRWFPMWLRLRYPIQYRSEKFEMGVLYPDFEAGLTGERTIVYYKDAG